MFVSPGVPLKAPLTGLGWGESAFVLQFLQGALGTSLWNRRTCFVEGLWASVEMETERTSMFTSYYRLQHKYDHFHFTRGSERQVCGGSGWAEIWAQVCLVLWVIGETEMICPVVPRMATSEALRQIKNYHHSGKIKFPYTTKSKSSYTVRIKHKFQKNDPHTFQFISEWRCVLETGYIN